MNETKTRSSGETASFHGTDFIIRPGGLTGGGGAFFVSVIVSSRGIAAEKEKSNSLLPCPGLHNLPFTFYIFIFESAKQRTQTISNRWPCAICTGHEFS